jgi:biopolymer transport protein ExbB/TolQ
MAATVTVVCPKCRNKMKASGQHIGRQGRCPACKALVPINPSETESLVGLVPEDPSGSGLGGRSRGGETDVNSWLAAAIGLIVTFFLYSIFILLKVNNYKIGTFMCENVAIESMITFVCCWSAALLIMKYAAVRRQLVTPDRELELIPLDIGLQITAGNVDDFLSHMNRLPAQRQDSILLRRIRGALEHFKFRNSVPEVQTYLSTQAEIDASGVDSGYTLLRAFIWVCPILGFVGTVMGISGAMFELRHAVSKDDSPPAVESPVAASDDFSEIKDALKGVTSNLATAFSATLLGLVATILLLFPTELLRRAEYATLDRIEVYANESLLRRMSEGPSLDKDPAAYAREVLQTAFQQHQQWLAQWQDQVSSLGQVIGGKLEVALREGVQRLAKDEAARLDRMGKMAGSLDQVLDHARRTTEAAQRTSDQTSSIVARTSAAIGHLQESLTGFAAMLQRLSGPERKPMEHEDGFVPWTGHESSAGGPQQVAEPKLAVAPGPGHSASADRKGNSAQTFAAWESDDSHA